MDKPKICRGCKHIEKEMNQYPCRKCTCTSYIERDFYELPDED